MPNQPDPRKTTVTAQIEVEDFVKLCAKARRAGKSRSKFAASILHSALEDEVLDEDGHARVAEIIRENKRKRGML